MSTLPDGITLHAGALDIAAQQSLLGDIRGVVSEAPLFVPIMPRTGKPMTVKMSNCGTLGWVTDKAGGYRYQASHPDTGMDWPAIPDALMALWHRYAGYPHPPEACLINFYDDDAKMGMHQDRDEEDLDAPVLSISLGDECRFRVGGTERGGKTASVRLQSGDIIVLGGPARLAYHGVDRIYPGTSMLLKDCGRINLTMRRVTKP